jgi:hypothetical protein
MAEIHIRIDEVKRVKADMESATGFHPMADQIFDPTLYPEHKIVDLNGRTEEEAAGDLWWPDSTRIPKEKVPATYLLVGDEGVYLMSNRDFAPGQTKAVVAYVIGCEPGKDWDYYDEKRRVFGGDDGAVVIPVQWVDHAIAHGADELILDLTAEQVRYVPISLSR